MLHPLEPSWPSCHTPRDMLCYHTPWSHLVMSHPLDLLQLWCPPPTEGPSHSEAAALSPQPRLDTAGGTVCDLRPHYNTHFVWPLTSLQWKCTNLATINTLYTCAWMITNFTIMNKHCTRIHQTHYSDQTIHKAGSISLQWTNIARCSSKIINIVDVIGWQRCMPTLNKGK